MRLENQWEKGSPESDKLESLEWALKFLMDYERKHKGKPKLCQIRENLEKKYPEAFE